MKNIIISASFAALFLLSSNGTAIAQNNFPDRPISIVVPFPAGGSVDIVARTYARKLSSLLNQSVVVENKAGANGTIGAQYVASANADGHTLLLASSGTFTITPVLQKIRFDPIKDFTYLGLVTNYTNILLVGQDSPYHSLQDIVERAKKHPGEVTFGSSGIGGSNHLGGELMAYKSGAEMLHVPYTGNAPAMTDLLGGRIDFMFDITTTARNHIAGGKVRPLAIASTERNPIFPTVPTIEEAGIPGAEFNGWFGMMGPAGLPEETSRILSEANEKIVNDPDFSEQILEWGYSLPETAPEAMVERVESDLSLIRDVVEQAGIKIE